MRPPAQKSTEASSVHTSPFSGDSQTKAPESRTGNDLRIRVPFRVENMSKTASTQELTLNMYSLSSQALREEQHAADLPLHHTSTSTTCQCTAPQRATTAVVARKRAHHELVQELELLKLHGVDELNLGHLHSYPSPGRMPLGVLQVQVPPVRAIQRVQTHPRMAKGMAKRRGV